MSESVQVVKISDSWATPGALGLTGFSLSTIMLGFVNMGLVEDAIALVAFSIFVGGLAQFCSGIMAFVKGSTFDMVAFTAFGAFWMSFAYILLTGTGTLSLTIYLLIWGLLAAVLTIGVIKLKARALICVLGLLAVVFVLTAVATYTGIAIVMTVAAALTIILGLIAFYTAMAITLNEIGFKLPL